MARLNGDSEGDGKAKDVFEGIDGAADPQKPKAAPSSMVTADGTYATQSALTGELSCASLVFHH